jgi:hypothetical protein
MGHDDLRQRFALHSGDHDDNVEFEWEDDVVNASGQKRANEEEKKEHKSMKHPPLNHLSSSVQMEMIKARMELAALPEKINRIKSNEFKPMRPTVINPKCFSNR